MGGTSVFTFTVSIIYFWEMTRNHASSLPRVADISVFQLSSRKKCWAQYYGRPWILPFHGRQILDRQHRLMEKKAEEGKTIRRTN